METFELKTPIDEKRITKSDNIEPTTRPDISRDVYLPVFVALVLLWLFAFGGLLIISGYRELAPSMLFGLPILIAAGLSTIVLIGRLKYYDDASFKRTIIELQPVEENGPQFDHVENGTSRRVQVIDDDTMALIAKAWLDEDLNYIGDSKITSRGLIKIGATYSDQYKAFYDEARKRKFITDDKLFTARFRHELRKAPPAP